MTATAETEAAEFRHAIGDCLYELYRPHECNDMPDEVIMWPVAKVTDRYAWVHGARFYDRDRTYRFNRADLEAFGRAVSRAGQVTLYVRPHHPGCLVARHPDPSTWETPGFPWCTCPPEFRESLSHPTPEGKTR